MVEDEEAIVARWVGARDAEAFRTISMRYSTMVYATCRRILPNEGDAEDVSQECFETLAVATSPPASYLGPWLHRVATNLSLKRVRTDSRRAKRDDAYAREHSAQTEVEWDDVYRFVDEAIAELPEKLRAVVVARYLEAQTMEAIGKQLGVSPRTVAYRVEKGLTLVRCALQKRGIAVGAATLATMMGSNMAGATVLPATLTAALGKLAIASQSTSFTSTAATTIGGFLIMKKAGITAVVLLGVALTYWTVTNEPTEPRIEPVNVAQTVEPIDLNDAGGEVADEPHVEADVAEEINTTPVDELEPVPMIEDEASEEPVEIVLGTISGNVVDEKTRRGLQGVTITATSGETEFTTETDWTGGFELAELSFGDYEIISAVPLGYCHPLEEKVVSINVSEGRDPKGVEFAFELGGSIKGVITRGHAPMASTSFELSHSPNVGEPYVEFIDADEHGAYTLNGLPPGGRKVIFRSIGEASISHKVPVIVDPGKTTVVDVSFRAGSASLEGMVYRDENTPLEAKLEVHALEHIYYATSNEDGHYKFNSLPAGQVQLLCFNDSDADDDAPIQRKIFALDLKASQELTQDVWFVDTTVACHVDNIPETNVEAFVTALKGEVDFSVFNIAMLGTITRQRVAIGEISVDGTATLKNLEPGTYTIAAISFPTNPSAIESLGGKELMYFMKNLAASNAEVITIEAATGEISVELTF